MPTNFHLGNLKLTNTPKLSIASGALAALKGDNIFVKKAGVAIFARLKTTPMITAQTTGTVNTLLMLFKFHRCFWYRTLKRCSIRNH